MDSHRDGSQCAGSSDTTNGEEDVACALGIKPVAQEEGEAEGEHVLHKVHGRECFTGTLSVAINHISSKTSHRELNAQIDEPEAHDDGHRPWCFSLGCLAPGKESSSGEEEIRDHDG